MIKRQAGKVVVMDKPMQQLSRSSVKDFLTNNLDIIEYSGYVPYVGGSAVYDFDNARDLDLFLLGNVSNIKLLEDLFHCLYNYAYNVSGFELDVKWVKKLDSLVDWEGDPVHANVEFIVISNKTYINTNEGIEKNFNAMNLPNRLKISDWLVKSTWDNGYALKAGLVKYFQQHKTTPRILARDFLNSLS